MRTPRALDAAEQAMIAEALRYRASSIRTEVAQHRTRELLTRMSNDVERRGMNQRERDLSVLAELLEDRGLRVEIVSK